MPQTAITRKPQASLLCLTGRGDDLHLHPRPVNTADRNLVQCVRRKLYTQPQSPVRCQRRPYPRPGKNSFRIPCATATSGLKVKKTISCPENAGCATPQILPVPSSSTPRCKKSLSMIDLYQGPTTDSDIGDLRSESSSTLARLEEVEETTAEALGDGVIPGCGLGVGAWIDRLGAGGMGVGPLDTHKAAGRVCHVLVVNAWRRRREEISELQDTIQQLGQQVDHLHIQIVVLRRLLDAENSRVGRFMAEMHQVRMQLDDTTHERDTLKLEKGKAEKETQRLKDVSDGRMVTTENLRNELITAQTQLQALDAQMSRDREKLLKLREDKKILLDKVSVSEALASERGSRAERAETAAEDLEVRLAAQIALVASAHDYQQICSKEVMSKEGEKLKLEKKLRSSEDAGRALSLRAANLESQLSDREAALRRLESAYNSQLSELNDLRERLSRQSQEGGWSSRVLQIAGTVVRAPRAILRTLSFLSNPGASVPS